MSAWRRTSSGVCLPENGTATWLSFYHGQVCGGHPEERVGPEHAQPSRGWHTKITHYASLVRSRKPAWLTMRRLCMGEKDTTGDRTQPLEADGSGNLPESTSATPSAGRTRRRWVLIVAAIAGLSMVTAGIAIAVFSPIGVPAMHSVTGEALPPQPTAPASSRHAATRQGVGHAATRQGVKSPPQVASDGVARTALRFPKSRTRQVLHWKAGPGGRALAAVTAQMGYALQASGARLYFPMKLACARLASDIRTAQTAPPIPDAAMWRMYNGALARLSLAAANCRQAISVRLGDESTQTHVQNGLLHRSLAELAAGSRTLYTATAEISALSHK